MIDIKEAAAQSQHNEIKSFRSYRSNQGTTVVLRIFISDSGPALYSFINIFVDDNGVPAVRDTNVLLPGWRRLRHCRKVYSAHEGSEEKGGEVGGDAEERVETLARPCN